MMTRLRERPVEPHGPRLTWPELPEQVRGWVAEILGAPVEEAASQVGGFSPGVAERVRSAGGRRAFVKACGSATNEHTPGLLAQEAGVLPLLPAAAQAPDLLGWRQAPLDDEHWVVLVVEDIPGRHPYTPWVAGDVDAALDAYRRLVVAPVPDDPPWPTLPEAMSWEVTLMAALAVQDRAGLHPWVQENLEQLVALSQRAPEALAGEAIVHLDARSDNLLITGGRARIVDWPWACIGAPWFDTLALAMNARLYDTGADVTAHLRAVADLGGTPEQVDAVLALLLGYFSYVAAQAPPRGLPTLRPFQQAQADALRTWMATRLQR